MKKILIVLMLLYVPVQAVEYLDSSVTIIDQMRINLNLAHTNVTATDSVCLGFVYEGAIIASAINRGRLMIDTIFADTGIFILALDTNMMLVEDVIWKDDSLYGFLQWSPKERWYDIESEVTNLYVAESGVDKHPTHYDWQDGYIFFYPIPALYDTMIITGFAKPDDMMADSEFVQDIAVTHRPAILYYATSMLALRLGRIADAQAWEAKYSAYINMLNTSKQKIPKVPSE